MRKTRSGLGRDRAFALLMLNKYQLYVPTILSESVAHATYRLGGRDPPGGGVLGLIFAGYVPLASQSLYPIIVTLLKMRPHYSQSCRENATPSSGTSLLASYKDVPLRG